MAMTGPWSDCGREDDRHLTFEKSESLRLPNFPNLLNSVVVSLLYLLIITSPRRYSQILRL
jgi:hypothetical protein